MFMADKLDLRNCTFEELKAWIEGLGWEPYRAEQLFRRLFQPGVQTFDQMTNLSKKRREVLEERAYLSRLTTLRVETSQDGTRKYLFHLEDGEKIESVLIPERGHFTLCVSTQVGCRQGCRFCLTGKGGLKRNLKTSEILNQVLAVKGTLSEGDPPLTNIVFMGMGEPLDNFENTVKALKILFSPWGMQFSHRHVTLSTVGLVPKMQALGAAVPVNLAVSLNAADDATRSRLMPVNRKYPLTDLISACKVFPLPHQKRITFEYVLLREVNDTPEMAKRLAALLSGVKAKINLIPFNPHPGTRFQTPEEERILRFQDILLRARYTVVVRRSKGADISAACGQLRATMDSE